MSPQLSQAELAELQIIADQIEEVMVTDDIFSDHHNEDVMWSHLRVDEGEIARTKFVISRTHATNARWAVLAVAKLCNISISQNIVDNDTKIETLGNMIGEHVEALGEQFVDAFYTDARLDAVANAARSLSLSGFKMKADGNVVAVATVPGAQEAVNENATRELEVILSTPVLQISKPIAPNSVGAFANL